MIYWWEKTGCQNYWKVRYWLKKYGTIYFPIVILNTPLIGETCIYSVYITVIICIIQCQNYLFPSFILCLHSIFWSFTKKKNIFIPYNETLVIFTLFNVLAVNILWRIQGKTHHCGAVDMWWLTQGKTHHCVAANTVSNIIKFAE